MTNAGHYADSDKRIRLSGFRKWPGRQCTAMLFPVLCPAGLSDYSVFDGIADLPKGTSAS
jgi:hypothetical protein